MAMSIKSLKFLLEHSIDENGDTAITPFNLPVISISSIRNKLSGDGELKEDSSNYDSLQNVNISFKKMEQQKVFVTKRQYREINNNLRDEIVFTRDYIIRAHQFSVIVDINRFVYKVKLIFSARKNDRYIAQMGGLYTSYIDTISRFSSTHSKHTICNRKIFTDKSSECFLSDYFKIKDSMKNETKEGNITITGKGYNNIYDRFTLSYLLANTNQDDSHFPSYMMMMGRKKNHGSYFYGWDSNYQYKTDSDFVFKDRHLGRNQDIIFRNRYGAEPKNAILERYHGFIMSISRNDVYYIE